MHPRLTAVLAALEGVALLAYAISALIEARKRRLDAVGAFVIAFVTAFGGGTVRDLLLNRRPFYWVQHENYLLAVFAMSLCAPVVVKTVARVADERALLAADAVGLGLFSVSGTSYALAAGLPAFPAVLMGVVTGVFGGLLRDVFCNETPLLFRDSRPYATCAFGGCWLYVGLDRIGVADLYAVATASAAILLARMITLKFDVRLPH